MSCIAGTYGSIIILQTETHRYRLYQDKMENAYESSFLTNERIGPPGPSELGKFSSHSTPTLRIHKFVERAEKATPI